MDMAALSTQLMSTCTNSPAGKWGPLAEGNAFLQQYPTDDKMATGGVMNDPKLAPLRNKTYH
jgi:hypothetical protein